jgi:hypothetical protein
MGSPPGSLPDGGEATALVIDAGRDRVRTLRVIGAAADPLAARLALERALAPSNLRPAGISPGAILCVRRLRMAIPRHSADRWAARLDEHVGAFLPGVVRPFREPASSDAPAVLFADEAEMLACLVRDWRRGSGDAWWWRSLFGERAGERLIQHTLAGAPASVPAAFELLVDAGLAPDAILHLPPPYCDELGASVARTFAVAGWSDAPPAPDDEMNPTPARPSAEQMARPPRAADGALARIARACDFTALAPPQRALLGIALLLRRDPRVARAPGLVAMLRGESWHVGPTATVGSFAEPRAGTNPVSAPTAGTDRASPAVARDASDSRMANRSAPAPLRVPDRPSDSPATRPSSPDIEAAADAGRKEAVPRLSPMAPEAEPSGLVVDSDAAGVVYLVNLALHLGLYADFTRPLSPGLALPLGDFVALVAERVCGDPIRDDPIWNLLGALAGRAADEPPGADFDPGEPIERWVGRLIRDLASAAAPRLDLDAGAALEFLCRRPGWLALSATRLDVYFPLADHPLEIRIAGLDRNPGWVPAAGRIIDFHYD